MLDRVRPGARVYGPYLRKDGRKHVIVWYSKSKQKTISYPKWLMEQHLGRKLHADETVGANGAVCGSCRTSLGKPVN